MSNDEIYDKSFINPDDVDADTFSLNPDFYIHLSILQVLNSQKVIDLEEMFIRFRLAVNQLYTIARASNRIGDKYDVEIDKYKKSKEYINEKSESKKSLMLSEKKFGLIMKELNQFTPIEDSLSI